MRTTVLISDRQPDTLRWPLLLARGSTDEVTVALLDSAAELVRPRHPRGDIIDELLSLGVEVLVDVGALGRRGMRPTDVRQGVKPTDLAAVGDLLVDATDKVVWL